MATPVTFTLAVIVLMIILIAVDKLPFGAPPLLALLLMVVFGVTDIKTVFGGFSNSAIMMLASFTAIIAALQKTSLLLCFKETMFNLTAYGGFKAYILLILVAMLGCSLFEAGSTAYYVLIVGLLSNLPNSKALPPSRALIPAGFAANHPLPPFNMALQYGIVIAVLQSIGISANVDPVKFLLVNLCLSLGLFAWCVLAYRIMPDHPITNRKADESGPEKRATLSRQKETIIYVSFIIVVVGMVLQSKIDDAGYATTALAAGVSLITGVMSFDEIRSAINAPTVLMSAGVIGITDALGNTGLTNLVGQTVVNMLGSSVNSFVLIFAFCILTSMLATLIGSTISTIYVFAPIAIMTCVSPGPDPTVVVAAIMISGWYGRFLPIDGIPAIIMGARKYKVGKFWEFMVPQYFIRLLVLAADTVIPFPMK